MSPVLKSLAHDDMRFSCQELSSVRDVRDKQQTSTSPYSSMGDTIKSYHASPIGDPTSTSIQSRPGVLVSSLGKAQEGEGAEGLPSEVAELLQQKLVAVQEENELLHAALVSSERKVAAYKTLVKQASQQLDKLEYYKTQAQLATGRAEVFLQSRATMVKQHKRELSAARSSTQLAVHRVLQLEKQVQLLQHPQQQQQPQRQQEHCGASPSPKITAPAVSRLAGAAHFAEDAQTPRLRAGAH